MSGKDFQEEAMLAAVKPFKASHLTVSEGPKPTALRQLSAADSDSLEGLFERHHDRVFRTAHRVTGSAADAEDVLQTVFLRVARARRTSRRSRSRILLSADCCRSPRRSPPSNFLCRVQHIG